MPKPTLILYTSNSCGACERFLEKSWEDVKKKVANDVMAIKHLSQPSMRPVDWNPEMPVDLKSRVSYFPSLFLIRSADLGKKDAKVTAELYPVGQSKDVVEWIKEMSVTANLTNATPTGTMTKAVEVTSTPSAAHKTPSATVVRSTKLPTVVSYTQPASCSAAYVVKGKK